MKKLRKLFLATALLFGAANYATAQTDSSMSSAGTAGQQGSYYYYYPEANVYVNQKGTDYWYYDAAGSNWATAKKLPVTYKINKSTKRNMVYYKGTGEVWSDNAAHVKRYGVKPTTPPQN